MSYPNIFTSQRPARFLSAAFLAGLLGAAQPLIAQSVVLEGTGGGITIEGDLLSYENGFFKVATTLGEFNISAASVVCKGESCPKEEADIRADFAIIGSDTIGGELMPLLVKGFSERQGIVIASTSKTGDHQVVLDAIADDGFGEEAFKVMIEDRGSSTGFEALLENRADIAMSSRKVTREEAAALLAAGLGDPQDFAHEHTLAVDGLLITVHPDNPVGELYESEITDLLSGDISNWAELGGPDLPVKIYSRDTNSGTFATVNDRFLRLRGLELSPDAQIVADNEQMASAVTSDPGAIGYIGYAYGDDVKPVTIVQECGLKVAPTAFNAKAGEYPLQRMLYLYTTNKELSSDAVDLLNFSVSQEANGLVEKAGFISFGISKRDQEEVAAAVRAEMDQLTSANEANVARELYIDLLDHERLSTTFRFATGSSSLDNLSQSDLVRLAEYLGKLPDGTEVSLVGFTDSDGSFEANRGLAQGRAAAVQDLIENYVGAEALSNVRFTTKGYGELHPVGCNDNFAGQRLNRRVEVWVKKS